MMMAALHENSRSYKTGNIKIIQHLVRIVGSNVEIEIGIKDLIVRSKDGAVAYNAFITIPEAMTLLGLLGYSQSDIVLESSDVENSENEVLLHGVPTGESDLENPSSLSKTPVKDFNAIEVESNKTSLSSLKNENDNEADSDSTITEDCTDFTIELADDTEKLVEDNNEDNPKDEKNNKDTKNEDSKEDNTINQGKQLRYKKQYKCKVCGLVSKCESHYLTHQRVHTNETPFSCSICERRFKRNYHAKLHMLNIHNVYQPAKDKTSKAVPDDKSIKTSTAHSDLVVNQKKPELLLRKSDSLIKDIPISNKVCENVSAEDTGDNLSKATVESCGESSSAKRKEMDVNAADNRVETDNVSDAPETVPRKRRKGCKPEKLIGEWKCHVCGLVCRKASALKIHQRVHTNERPFVCVICDLGFKRDYHLKRHKYVVHNIETATEQDELSNKNGTVTNSNQCEDDINNLDVAIKKEKIDSEISKIDKSDIVSIGGEKEGNICINLEETIIQLHDVIKVPKLNDKTITSESTTTTHASKQRSNGTEKPAVRCTSDSETESDSHDLEQTSNTKQSSEPKTEQLYCSQCEKCYKSHGALLTHMNEVCHVQCTGGNVCNVCGFKTKSKYELDKHKQIHHNDEFYPFTCSICKQKFKSKPHLTRHMKILHHEAKEQKHVCMFCQESFEHRFVLIKHMSVHEAKNSEPGILQCPYCDHTAPNGPLRVHVRRHRGEKNHVCEFCAKSFITSYNLTMHVKQKHTTDKPYMCSSCPAKYTTEPSLKVHMKTHTEAKTFMCTECPKIFRTKSSLTQHERIHSGYKPYVCICGQAFSQMGNFQLHSKKHIGIKAYKCALCPYSSYTEGDVTKHNRTHTKERPYQCDYCSVTFADSSNLKAHIRIHTNEKPYECQFCGYRCRHPSVLRAHERRHNSGGGAVTGGKFKWNVAP